jgi:hypothetical protein
LNAKTSQVNSQGPPRIPVTPKDMAANIKQVQAGEDDLTDLDVDDPTPKKH